MTTTAGQPRPRNAAPRAASQRQPVRVPATLIEVSDREGLARFDTGGVFRVHLPDVLWLRTGDRVLLYRFPGGWVVVLLIRIGDALSFEEHGNAR